MASWLVAGDSPGRGWCSFQEGYGERPVTRLAGDRDCGLCLFFNRRDMARGISS